MTDSAVVLERLYNLLPGVYRRRDIEQGGQLRALLSVVAEQLALLEDDIAQLYDDQFIETCAEWVVPYIGDLVGARGVETSQPEAHLSQRALVAHTLAYRRRKGTAAVLEQIARDMTGWEARAVEYFALVGAAQHVKRVRPGSGGTAALRDAAALDARATPFDSLARTADVRRISRGRGQFNVPNVGIFLWRQRSYSLTDVPAVKVDNWRYLVNPLGGPLQLFRQPQTEDRITHLAQPANVPLPITRRDLDRSLADLYGPDASVSLTVDGAPIAVDQIVACNLSDVGAGWAHAPTDKFGIDPELGRLTMPLTRTPPTSVHVDFHYGFAADMGGGEYDRASTLDSSLDPVQRVPGALTTIPDALNALQSTGGGGVVEITDNATYALPTNAQVSIPGGQRVEIRASDSRRPHVVLTGDTVLTGGPGSELTLNGLLISGDGFRITGQFNRVSFRHCTLVASVPGASPRIVVEALGATIEVDHSILVGGLRAPDGSMVTVVDSIVDATDPTDVAYSATNAGDPGAPLDARNATFIGKVDAAELTASNSIFLAALSDADTWSAPVRVLRRQAGYVRYSFVPLAAAGPRRYRCQPERPSDEGRVRPLLTSSIYGAPGYGQLHSRCPREIVRGADDESEMGAFHDTHAPRRESGLRARLAEFLPFGMEAGVFYAS
jgi:hypothetical protein